MRSPKVEYTIKDLKRKREYAFRCEFDFTSVSLEEIDTVLNHIEELEEKIKVCSDTGARLISTEFIKNNYIHKNILRKIKANTDTRYDFTEEVLKLL